MESHHNCLAIQTTVCIALLTMMFFLWASVSQAQTSFNGTITAEPICALPKTQEFSLSQQVYTWSGTSYDITKISDLDLQHTSGASLKTDFHYSWAFPMGQYPSTALSLEWEVEQPWDATPDPYISASLYRNGVLFEDVEDELCDITYDFSCSGFSCGIKFITECYFQFALAYASEKKAFENSGDYELQVTRSSGKRIRHKIPMVVTLNP